MKVNDLIFRELIGRGYSIRGKTRIWNLSEPKLLYLTPELTKGFLNLTKFSVYKKKVYDIEVDLLKKNALNILAPFDGRPFNLIDLGCGDGIKAKEFIKSLKGKSKLRYCPVDISDYLINRAIENISAGNFKNVNNFDPNVSDFEHVDNVIALLRNNNYQKNLIFLLGSTLGNFEINDFLFTLSNAMIHRDFLVIGNGIRTGERLVSLETYKNKFFDKWFFEIMRSLGFRKNEVGYSARFAHSRVEFYYKIKVNKKIQHLGKKVEFKKGDEIVIAVLYKYYEDELVESAKRYFRTVDVVKDSENEYALLICKK